MDIGAEISKKIQMAITAKLKELDAYVDDELPDYIMIMVANKKTEEQMTDALSLFLSGNTKTFTSWLHNLLSSLRKGKGDKGLSVKDGESDPADKSAEETSLRRTFSGPRQKKSLDLTKTDTIKRSASSKPQSEAIITIDNNDMHELFDEELIAESSAAELMASEVKVDEPPKLTKQVPQKEPTSALQQGTKIRSTKVDKGLKRKPFEPSTLESFKSKKEKAQKVSSEKLDKKKPKTRKPQSSKRTHSSEIKSEKSVREWDRGKGKDFDEMHASTNYRKHGSNRDRTFYSESESEDEMVKKGRVVSSTVNQMTQDPEFVSESDSDDDSKSKVSSRVTYPKRTMRVPLNKQANKALFMKAVNAAEKSVKTVGTGSDIQIDEMELKMSTLRKNKQLGKVGKREYADNDARRKLQIKKAISEAFESQVNTSSRRGKNKIGDRRPSSENSKNFETRETLVQDANPVKKAKVAAKLTKAKNHNPENYPQSDQRKFIIQSERKQVDQPVIAFDSREAVPRTSQENVNAHEEKVLSPTPVTNVDSVDKMMPSKYVPQNFIVTMDGVIRSKHNSKLSEDERKAARIKKFKSETNNNQAKLLMVQPDKLSSAMQELEKMKDKILQVERESSKLKQMQLKLAAVQNGTGTSSGTEQRSISVANVHYSATEKQLSDYFSICGKVLRTTILRDIATGHPKGFAYLEFEDTGAVASALALNNTQLNNRAIRVTVKQPSSAITAYQPHRGYHRPYHGRVARGFPSTFRPGRFAQFGAVTRNKTWINPTISGSSKS